MTRQLVLILAAIAILFATAATAQTGAIYMAADPAGTDCNIRDQSGGLLLIYAVHVLGSDVRGSKFSAPMPSCMVSATYLSDFAYFESTSGNSQTGVSIDYGTCLSGVITLLIVQYLAVGLSTPCCCYFVYPFPGETHITVQDCEDGAAPVFDTTPNAINRNVTCACTVGHEPTGCVNAPVPVEERTWGQIKSLYR